MDENNGGTGFSPFDAPIKDTTKKPGASSDVKMEEISEAEATGQNQDNGEFNEGGEGAGQTEGGDGNPPGAQPPPPPEPKDAPAFQPPNFNDVPGYQAPPPGEGGEDPTSDEPAGGGKEETTKVPEGFSKEFADYTAEWLVDIYFKLFLGAIRNYCKIDKTEVLRAVNKGIINPKFVKFIENINNKVDSELDVTEEEKKFVIEPLQQFIVMKKIAVKPEYLMLGSLIMVSGTIFLRAQELKEQNKIILDQILKESADIQRNGGRGGGGSAAEAMAQPPEPKDPIDVETFTPTTEVEEEGTDEQHI
jgi:hypothetical protein